MANYKTTLKDITKQNTIYPQTTSDIVIREGYNGQTVEEELVELSSKLDRLKDAEKFVGYYPNENALLSAYPNNISNPSSREGYFARVGGVGENETYLYLWDVEGNKWVQSGGAGGGTGSVDSVNGKDPDTSGNVYLTAGDIPTVFQDGASVQSHLADLQNKYNDLDSAITEIEPELDALKNKPLVLYLTNQEMTNAVNSLVEPYDNGQLVIATNDGTYSQGSAYVFVVGGTAEYPEYSWDEISTAGSGGGNGSVTKLEGTQENPIILSTLTEGLYYLTGYFKVSPVSQDSYTFQTFNLTTGSYTNTYGVFMSIDFSYEGISYGMMYSASWYGQDVSVVLGQWDAEVIGTRFSARYDSEWPDVYVLNMANKASGTDLESLRTETKNNIAKLEKKKPVVEVADPTTLDTSYANSIVTSVNTNDKSLYYGKIVNSISQLIVPEYRQKYTNLYMLKSIVTDINNHLASVQPNTNVTTHVISLSFFTADNLYTYSQQIYISSNPDNVVTRIFNDNGYDLYTLENGWTQQDGNTDELFDMYNFLKQYTYNPDISNVELEYVGQFVSFDLQQYVKTNALVNVVDSVKLALYEDLANVSGGLETLSSSFILKDLSSGLYLVDKGVQAYYESVSSDQLAFTAQSKLTLFIENDNNQYQTAYFYMYMITNAELIVGYGSARKSTSVPSTVNTHVLCRFPNSTEFSGLSSMNLLLNGGSTTDTSKRYIGTTTANYDQFIKYLSDFYVENNALYFGGNKVITETGAVVNEYLGIKNTDGTIDQIKHINNNFQITSASGQSLLNIDEQLETVTMFNEKVLRASDFELNELGTILTIYLD